MHTGECGRMHQFQAKIFPRGPRPFFFLFHFSFYLSPFSSGVFFNPISMDRYGTEFGSLPLSSCYLNRESVRIPKVDVSL